MRSVLDVDVLQELTTSWRRQGLRIGFVPTMGFLHEGHCSLMDLARPRCDKLVVSIFVNPIQFGEGEDLDVYPRDPTGDALKCARHGTDVLFMPETFYPKGFSTRVALSGLTQGLCGGRRPGHFEGVTTVVARLFNLVQPHIAVFGEKDYQQLQVIRRMVLDLAMHVDVVGGPLIRDPDGLAMSSRNAYLTPEQREQGLSLHRALFAMQESGLKDVAALKQLGLGLLKVDRMDYLEVVNPHSLQPVDEVWDEARVLVAGFVGSTRLIDNIALTR
jgi:pantoate--beta-alanine ligase